MDVLCVNDTHTHKFRECFYQDKGTGEFELLVPAIAFYLKSQYVTN